MLLITRERSKRLPRRAILRPKLFLMKVLMENSSVAQSQAVYGQLELYRDLKAISAGEIIKMASDRRMF